MAQTGPAGQLLHFTVSVATLLFAFFSFLFNYGRVGYGKPTRRHNNFILIGLGALLSISYIVEGIFLLQGRHALSQNQAPDHIFAMVILSLAWISTSIPKSVWIHNASGLGIISLIHGCLALTIDVVEPVPTTYHRVLLVTVSVRLCLASVLEIVCAIRYFHTRNKKGLPTGEEEEARPFLNEPNGQAENHYDATMAPYSDHDGDSDDEEDSDLESDEDEEDPDTRIGALRKTGHWVDYLRSFKVFLPYLTPKRDIKVQFCLLLCVLCLIADRVLNLLVPTQLGNIADKLFERDLPLSDLGVYFVLNILHGQSGLELVLSLARIPIEQFSYRQLTNAAFSHVMDLAMDFHSNRDSAEVMKAIEQGEALTRVLETGLLEIAPAMIDLLVAFVFLYIKFNSSAALCMLIATLAFIGLEVATSQWNVPNRRELTKADRAQARAMHQAIQGWLTVSSFNMSSYERARFAQAVDTKLAAQRKWSQRDVYTTGLLEAFFPASFVVLACLVAHEIRQGRASPGDFVFLIQYWDYLIMPIKYLSKDYRWLVGDFVDAERLLDLFLTAPTVTDKEGAAVLGPVKGHVEFEDVGFSYDDRVSAVHGVNLSAAPGQTIALVGATGAGKSSLMKLLLRYYDVTGGCIRIDGHDIRDVTLSSLRDVLGVVSQSPILFNASIMDNLRYARLSASEDEVYAACRAAAIHDKILTFPEGYNTKVGEQGVRLSGGEVQRLAIARAFLKDPSILILDEATSAIDTETEFEIQEALRRLSKDRTTVVIAHRLSTVVMADQILVLHDGTVVERGSHQQLMDRQGKYYNLWQKQLQGGTLLEDL
ncbi:P-loop containing nucleoside triphosphate hydrolase protein [Aspergillus bertholletiae]|uniref:P-loop containing nucleoside triphosphate hydrolase protein n=1 Tax=Aspergillus bertholletiae TaxID=1226010 RepID=A0A5N7B7K8_9EURO|nr:P-loop containing nucleoside triphosphate hydrolase protein [Aspergillus bertholletiae]